MQTIKVTKKPKGDFDSELIENAINKHCVEQLLSMISQQKNLITSRDQSINDLPGESSKSAVLVPPKSNVYIKTCYFLYLRWLSNKKGIYDDPPEELSIIDVGRLLECGAINESELDFPLGFYMALCGSYALVKGIYTTDQIQDKEIRPTEEKLKQFIESMEDARTSNVTEPSPFPLAPKDRPQIPEVLFNAFLEQISQKDSAGDFIKDYNKLDVTDIEREVTMNLCSKIRGKFQRKVQNKRVLSDPQANERAKRRKIEETKNTGIKFPAGSPYEHVTVACE